MKRSHCCTVCGRFNPELQPYRPPKKIHFPGDTDDKWNRTWNQCVTRHKVNPCPPPECSPVTEDVVKRIHGCTVCGRFNPELQLNRTSSHQVPSDNSARNRCVTRQEGVVQKKSRVSLDKRLDEHIQRLKEKEIRLTSTAIEVLDATFNSAHLEDRSLTYSILQKDTFLTTLKKSIERLEMEIKNLQERSKLMDDYRDLFLQNVPPEVHEVMERNLKGTQTDGTEEGNVMLLKSINESMGFIAQQQKTVCQGITSRIKHVERLQVEIKTVSKKMVEEQKVLQQIKYRRWIQM